MLALPWSSWKEKRRSSFRRYYGPKPDLNPVDYSVRSVLQENLYKPRITNVDDLKHRIWTEWSELRHVIFAAAVRQWRRRLSACARMGDGRFEYCF